MIQSIARKIRDGGCSAAELAAGVGLSQEQLKNRLALMERQGYIERDEVCGQTGNGCGGCTSCPAVGNRDRTTLPVQYHLTDKGRHLAEMKAP
jgi:predicted ArsR family transcriptional regulator